MTEHFQHKSTIEEIRARFDDDVDRFSNLESGQSATIDAPLAMELISCAAVSCTDPIRRVLDIGCGAGNNALKLCDIASHRFDVDLLDLSLPMLQRAQQRLSEKTDGKVTIIHSDFRDAELENKTYDVVIAAAVLHHLRDEADWKSAMEKVYRIVAPGGSFWITDLVTHETAPVHELMWKRYGDYLEQLGGSAYRDEVFAYIEKEDSPRPLTWQLDLLRSVGFSSIDVLHKHGCFAAFGACKAK